jgi:hypothetical protein
MIGYQDKINQILRGAETIKNMSSEPFRYNDDALVDAETINAYIEELEEVKLERDALWVKTQEDEREINDLRDANKELRDKIKKLELSLESL